MAYPTTALPVAKTAESGRLNMAKWPYNTEKWRRLRAAKLASDPLCHPCQLRGVLTPADTVDHIKAVSDGGDPFPDFDGLMSMCARCHNEKTNAMDRRDRQSSGRRFKGFDVNGNPVDPADAWHGGGRNHEIPADGRPMPTIGKYLVSDTYTETADENGGGEWPFVG